MTASWKRLTLGSICDRGGGTIRTGPFGSQLHERDYSESGTPVVMPKDIVAGRISEATIARVGPAHVDRLAQHKLVLGDIVYGRRGDIGRRALVTSAETGWVCGTGCLRISPGVGVVEPQFLYYALGHPATVEAIAKKAVGATMLNLNTAILRELELQIPDLQTQRRIASILGAYDDLIEVNRRRIALLEEMARRLFEEWFVHFRFPGRSAMEPAPEGQRHPGWQRVTLGALCERITDGAHHSPQSVDDGCWMASVKDMREWDLNLAGCRRISHSDFAELVRMGCQPCVGDILVAKDGANLNKHTVLICKELPVVLLSSIAIIRPRQSVPREFLLAQLKSQQTSDAIRRMRSGAAIPRIVLKDFKRLELDLPPQVLQQRFDDEVSPLHRLCRRLSTACDNLALQRDLLLPRLVSGDLSVTAAERELEAIA